MAPPVGLEPTTCRLTVCRATYCAKEAYVQGEKNSGIEPVGLFGRQVANQNALFKVAVIAFMYSTYFAFYLFTALPTASHISLGGHNR